MEGVLLPPALKKLTLVSEKRSRWQFYRNCTSPRSILSSRDFATSHMEQSHNHIKRFEGLVLPDGLEELFLVRSINDSLPCVIERVAARHQPCSFSQNYNFIATLDDVAVTVPSSCKTNWQPMVRDQLRACCGLVLMASRRNCRMCVLWFLSASPPCETETVRWLQTAVV